MQQRSPCLGNGPTHSGHVFLPQHNEDNPTTAPQAHPQALLSAILDSVKLTVSINYQRRQVEEKNHSVLSQVRIFGRDVQFNQLVRSVSRDSPVHYS